MFALRDHLGCGGFCVCAGERLPKQRRMVTRLLIAKWRWRAWLALKLSLQILVHVLAVSLRELTGTPALRAWRKTLAARGGKQTLGTHAC